MARECVHDEAGRTEDLPFNHSVPKYVWGTIPCIGIESDHKVAINSRWYAKQYNNQYIIDCNDPAAASIS